MKRFMFRYKVWKRWSASKNNHSSWFEKLLVLFNLNDDASFDICMAGERFIRVGETIVCLARTLAEVTEREKEDEKSEPET